MAAGLDSTVSARIQALRFLAICGIVVLHAPPYVPLPDVGSGPFDLLKAFLQHGLFRVAVPVLSVISGYLLFRSGLDGRPRDLLTKKARTLLLPLLLWNLPLVLAVYAAQSRGLMAGQDEWLPGAGPNIWLNALIGLRDAPVNYPLGFLRDLLTCVILVPLLSRPLRAAPAAGLVAIGLAALWNLDGLLFVREDVPICFFAGAVLACLRADVTVLDRQAVALLLVLLGGCAVFIALGDPAGRLPLRLAGAVCVWPATALLFRTRLGPMLARLGVASFWVFGSHAPILAALWSSWQILLPQSTAPAFLVLGPALTLLLSLGTYEVTVRLAPGLAALLTGGRVASILPRQGGQVGSAPCEDEAAGLRRGPVIPNADRPFAGAGHRR